MAKHQHSRLAAGTRPSPRDQSVKLKLVLTPTDPKRPTTAQFHHCAEVY